MSKPKYESVAKKYEIYGKYYALTKFRIDDTDGKKTLIITELKGTANGSETNPEYKYSLENVEIPNFNGSIYHISNNEYGTDAEFTIVPEKVTVTQLNEYETGVKRITDRTNAQNAANTVVSGIFDAAAKLKAEQDAAKLKAEQEAAKLKAEQDAEAAKLKAAEEEAAKLKAADDAEYKKQQLRLEEDAKQAELDAAKKAEEKRQLTEAYKSAMEAFNTQMKAFTQLYEQAKQLKTEAAALFNKDSPTEQDLQQANEMLAKLQSNKNEAELMANDLKDKLEAAGKARDAANSYNTQNQLSGDKAITIEEAGWQDQQKTAISNMLKGMKKYISDVEQAKQDAANKVKNTYESATNAFKTKMKEFNQLDTQATELKKDADALSNTEEDLQKANNMLTQLKGIQTKAKDMTTDLNTKLTDAVNARDAVLPYNSRNKAIKIEDANWQGEQTSAIKEIPTYIQEHIANVEKKVNKIKEAVEKEKKVKAIKEINESLTSLKSEIEKENEAKAQVDEAGKSVQAAEQKVKTAKQEQVKIQNEIKKIDTQIKDSESQIDIHNNKIQQYQNDYDSLDVTQLINSIKKTYKIDKDDVNSIKSQLNIRLTTLKNDIKRISNVTGLTGEAYKKHNKQLNDKIEEHTKLTEAISKITTNNQTLIKTREQLENEKKLLTATQTKLNKLNGYNTELETKKNKNTTEVESAEKELETANTEKEDADQTLKTATEAVTEAKKVTTQKISELETLLPQGDQKNRVSALKGNIEKATDKSIGGIQFTLEQIQNVIDSSKKKGGKTQRRRNPHRSTKKRSHSEKPI